MNIFFVNKDPEVAAQELNDKHVVKMTLESAQILCTVIQKQGIFAPYRSTHQHHPMVVWAGASKQNFFWLLLHLTELNLEYFRRYEKSHAVDRNGVLLHLWTKYKNREVKLDDCGYTPPPLCMPDKYKIMYKYDPMKGPEPFGSEYDTIASYQNYYNHEKAYFSKWKNGDIPSWFKQLSEV